ncbi:MAG: nicotinate (nicotinamide) nucleotide adenylyltransferase [Chloroflexota bacterium]|nr:nicotinate (nicotinamide) nucleotide adenylyltransferase [Chloroflexota bacterium]
MNLPGKNNKIKSVLFGGTFDPIHYGHIKIIEKIICDFNPKVIYIVPAGNPYMKNSPPLATPLQRLQMCELAFKNSKNIKIIDYEILRNSPSYTFDTLNYLSSEKNYINVDTLVLGEDSYIEIDKWKKGKNLKEKYNFIVVKRSNSFSKKNSAKGLFFMEKLSNLSSSLIRKKIDQNQSINNDTPIEIANYIEDNKLYKNG